MIIQQIRNATLKIKYGKSAFLIDPWLQDKGTGPSVDAVIPEMNGIRNPMNDLPEDPEEILKDVDRVLITHLHFDHFSPEHLPENLKIIAQNHNDAERLQKMGFKNTSCFEKDPLTIGDVEIHKTKAVHGDGEDVVSRMGEACGYVFRAPGEKTVYLAGDTIYCAEVEKTIREYHPDVIIVNCCSATMPVGRLLMDLSDLEKVCAERPQAVVIASHLDSVNHAVLTSEDIRKFARDKGLDQILVPANGECVEE